MQAKVYSSVDLKYCNASKRSSADNSRSNINKIEDVESFCGCIDLVKQRHPFKFAPDVFGGMEVESIMKLMKANETIP